MKIIKKALRVIELTILVSLPLIVITAGLGILALMIRIILNLLF